jgi:hypothetical protein
VGNTKRVKIIVDRGLEANLPFGFEPGRLYVCEDTRKIFAGQGVSLPLVLVGTGQTGLNFRGAWSNVTTYNTNDLVTFGNALYIALNLNSNEQPDLFPADWEVIISASTDNFFFTQSTPASVWTINHGLNKHPAVTVEDTTHRQVFAEVHYPSNGQVQVFFNAPESGYASCN